MEVIRAVLIHLIVPLTGIAIFLWLLRRMKAAGIEDPPRLHFFILFVTYGGLIVTVLTILFWHWSGMATLGLAYLILLAPILTLGLAVALFRERRLSAYHSAAFWLSVGYVPVLFAFGCARVTYYGLSWREYF